MQSFNDLSKFLWAYLSKSLADALNRERANLTDLGKALFRIKSNSYGIRIASLKSSEDQSRESEEE